MAKPRQVPVLVDAAAEILTVPNVHLENGATLVAYSGGKCLRGPQTAGLLLGRKDLVQAAWVHSAPHHGFARAMKVGKEEAIGDADGGRDVDEARPQGRVDAMAVVARRHREAGVDRRRRDDVGDGNDGAVEPDADAGDSVGSEAAAASPERRSPRLLMDTEPRIADAGRPGPGGREQHLDHAVQDGGGRRKDRRRAAPRHLSNPPKQDAAPRARRRRPRT